jgi:hypothetical protein
MALFFLGAQLTVCGTMHVYLCAFIKPLGMARFGTLEGGKA